VDRSLSASASLKSPLEKGGPKKVNAMPLHRETDTTLSKSPPSLTVALLNTPRLINQAISAACASARAIPQRNDLGDFEETE